jgi:hypothetical protein
MSHESGRNERGDSDHGREQGERELQHAATAAESRGKIIHYDLLIAL